MGVNSLGINFAFTQFYPIKHKATLINSFLVNCMCLLLSTPSILHLLSLLFRGNLELTGFRLFIRRFEEGHFMKKAMDYGVLVFGYLFFVIASVLTLGIHVLLWRRKLKAGAAIIISEETRDTSQLYVEWNKLLRMIDSECFVC